MSIIVARFLKLSTAWKFPLHGPRNYVGWSWEMPASGSAFFLLSFQTPFEIFKLKSLQQFTIRILPKLIVVLTLDSRENSSKRLKKACLCFLWYSSKRSRDLLLRRLWKEEMFLGNWWKSLTFKMLPISYSMLPSIRTLQFNMAKLSFVSRKSSEIWPRENLFSL